MSHAFLLALFFSGKKLQCRAIFHDNAFFQDSLIKRESPLLAFYSSFSLAVAALDILHYTTYMAAEVYGGH